MTRTSAFAALCVAALAQAASATTVTIDPGDSIQAALDNPAVDTIVVNPGTYDERLTIDRDVTLQGVDKSTTILTWTGAPAEQLVMLGDNTGTVVANVTIENLTFRNSGSIGGGGLEDADLIKFRASGGPGLITIRNNVFEGAGTSTGIEEAYQASEFVVTENEFVNCYYGIWGNGLQNGEISNNTFTDPTSAGIGMGGSGAGDDAPHDLSILGNTMSGGAFGLILAENLHDMTFGCNTITGAHTGILMWEYGPDDWANMVLENNSIFGNAVGLQGYYDAAGNPAIPVDVQSNWWGDASGPGGVGPGSGDSIFLSNVNYNNWLTSPPDCGGQPVIPEPLTMAGLMLGVAALGGYIRRRRG